MKQEIVRFSDNFYFSIFAVIFVAMFSAAADAQEIDEKSLNVLAGNKITGEWSVNYAESDNPILKMQTLLQNKIAQSSSEKNVNAENNILPTMSVSLVPPETLTIAGDDKFITIDEGFSEIVFTRILATDGKQKIGELQGGVDFLFTVTQINNLLKIETLSREEIKCRKLTHLKPKGKS